MSERAMRQGKPIAGLSLDLDNKWSYLKTQGQPGWKSFPSYLDVVVPRILTLLRERDLTITFFVVGQDAALEQNHSALKAIAADGHEIANHSFSHEPWLHLYSERQIETDFELSEQWIERATGQKPVGFRGPGYSLSAAAVRILARRGYQYDASTWPTFIGPLSRAYFFLNSTLSPEEKLQRSKLFGGLREGFRPNRPYQWKAPSGEVTEIPTTTLPILRLPIHASYVLYLSMLSPSLGLRYFKTALSLCRVTGTEPSLLLHPLDFLGQGDVPELSFFPAMALPLTTKLRVVDSLIQELCRGFRVLPIHRFAREVAQASNLPVMAPSVRPKQASALK